MDRAIRRDGEEPFPERGTRHMLFVHQGCETESSGKSSRSGKNDSDYRLVKCWSQNFFFSYFELKWTSIEIRTKLSPVTWFTHTFLAAVVKRICDERPNRQNFEMPRQAKITRTLGSILQKPHKEWRTLQEHGVPQADAAATMSHSNSATTS